MALAEYVAAVLADAPVCFYKLDETSGNPADSSGNGNNITSVDGAPTYRQAGPLPGSFSIRTADSSQLNRTPTPSVVVNNFTMEAWVKLGGAVGANDSGVWNVGSAGSNGWRLVLDTNGTFQVIVNPATALANSAGVLTAAGFRLITIVRRAGTWEYWLDGAADTANAGTTAPGAPGANSMQWAQDLAANYQTFWSLGSFYATALSAARIAAHYSAALASDAAGAAGGLDDGWWWN